MFISHKFICSDRVNAMTIYQHELGFMKTVDRPRKYKKWGEGDGNKLNMKIEKSSI